MMAMYIHCLVPKKFVWGNLALCGRRRVRHGRLANVEYADITCPHCLNLLAKNTRAMLEGYLIHRRMGSQAQCTSRMFAPPSDQERLTLHIKEVNCLECNMRLAEFRTHQHNEDEA